jgi:hypothetical protein
MIPTRTWVVVLRVLPAALLWGGCAASPPTVNEAPAVEAPESSDEPFPLGDLLVAPSTKEPLAATLPWLELTDAEVQAGDAITMVGYASGDDTSPAYGARHFGANRVSRLIHLETGSSVFRAEEQQLPGGAAAAHTQGGDSGGGLRQAR